ncbi:MAG: mannosyltransferase [Patescibacteria group bacterium]|nr:mannosyltransferase [Patescibacteria group bacterium]
MFKSKKRILSLQTKDWIIILISLIVFAFITFLTISKFSIWFDEAFGAYLSHFSFLDIAKYTASDVHPPLYYWLLKLWSAIFGNNEIAIRSMSAFFGGVSIVIGYLLINRLFDKKVARISLIFMVLSPMLVRYSQEARMYTMVTAIALAATYTLTFAITTKKKLPWIIYGILISLGMWTHYFSALVWISHWIWRADIIRRVSRKGEFIKSFFTREWIMAHVVAIALFVPWVPSFIYQVLNVQVNGFWIPAVTPDTILNFITNIIYYQEVGRVTGWLALALLLAVVLLITLAFKIYKLQNEGQRQGYRLIAILAFIPVILLFVLSMPPLRSSFVDRYLIPSTFFIALFIGVTLAFSYKLIGFKRQLIIIIFTIILVIVGINNVWQLGNYNKTSNTSNNARHIIETIISSSNDNLPIIADSPWLFYETIFYSTNEHPVYFIDEKTSYDYGSLDMLKYNNQHKIMDINAFTKINPVVWYIGCPGENNFDAPYSSWKAIRSITVNDALTGKPSYKAIQYTTVNN